MHSYGFFDQVDLPLRYHCPPRPGDLVPTALWVLDCPVKPGNDTGRDQPYRKMRRAPSVSRSRCEEFEVGNDAAITDFDDGDELGQRYGAGDARVHPGPPMHRRLQAVNQYRANNLIPELEGFDHHGQQRSELIDTDGSIGDRTDLAGAGDPEHGIIGKRPAYGVEIAAQPRRIKPAP